MGTGNKSDTPFKGLDKDKGVIVIETKKNRTDNGLALGTVWARMMRL